jgi:glutathione S-transferase
MMLHFYYAPRCCALASHIVLEEVGAEYERTRLDFTKQEQRSPAYLAINPKARVPALATSHGVLTETPAMLVYLAQLFPAAKLIPFDDQWAFAQVQSFNAYLCATVHVAEAHWQRGNRWVDPDDAHAIAALKRKVPTSVFDAFELVERNLTGEWVMGDTFTICDPYLFTLAQWMEFYGVNVSGLLRVIAHRSRVGARAATQRAIAEETAVAA